MSERTIADSIRDMGYSTVNEAIEELAMVRYLATLSSQAVAEPLETMRGLQRLTEAGVPDWMLPLRDASAFLAGTHYADMVHRPSWVYPDGLESDHHDPDVDDDLPELPRKSDDRAVYISLKQLAAELKMDRSACRRWVLSEGVEPVKKRMPDSHFQLALAVTREQADRLISKRREEGYL